MTQEITTPRKVILMKSGLPIFVSLEKAMKAEQVLGSGAGHRFLNITEDGNSQTINSAEIEGIYSPEQYEEIQRAKKGDWKCKYGKWHGKREECECHKEVDKKFDEYRRLGARIKEGRFDDDLQRESIERYFHEAEAWLKERNLI